MQIPKLLAQAAPAASTLTLLYRVPGCARTNINSLLVCNRAAVATTFRVAIAPLGAADAVAHYIYYDCALAANATHAAALDLKLTEKDELRVYTPSANVSCSVFGTEAF